MALTLSEVQAVTDDYWLTSPTDIYFQDSILLYKLLGKARGATIELDTVTAGELVDGGEKIRAILEYANSNTGSYGNTTSIEQGKKKILNAARFRWAGYFASNAIDLNDRVQNSGKAAKVSLIQSKVSNIRKTIRDTMGGRVYARAATNDSDVDFLGLGDLFYATVGTPYGEIEEEDMAQWAANNITTAEAISFKVLQTMRRTPNIGQNASMKPNLYITTDTLKDGFERTLQTQARYADVTLVNAGFRNVLFDGSPVVPDDKQTATYCDALNLRFLSIKTHEDFQFTKPMWQFDKEQPDTWVANTRWIGQLICRHRKAHVRHTNLTEPT